MSIIPTTCEPVGIFCHKAENLDFNGLVNKQMPRSSNSADIRHLEWACGSPTSHDTLDGEMMRQIRVLPFKEENCLPNNSQV